MMTRQEENALLERLKSFTTPELADGMGLYRTMDYEIKPQVKNAENHIVGRAFTVDVPVGEGDIVSDAIPLLQPGDVLVIAGKGCCRCSYWGDLRSIAAKLAGAVGVVVDGACRDIEGCEAAGFPVFAKGITPGTANKGKVGAMNVPVSCGGVAVHPGDFICADRNGVLVLRPEEAEAAMEKAMDKRIRQEATIEEMLRTGVVTGRVKKFA